MAILDKHGHTIAVLPNIKLKHDHGWIKLSGDYLKVWTADPLKAKLVLVGMQYGDFSHSYKSFTQQSIKALFKDDKIRLTHQPDNKKDPFATIVQKEGKVFSWLAKSSQWYSDTEHLRKAIKNPNVVSEVRELDFSRLARGLESIPCQSITYIKHWAISGSEYYLNKERSTNLFSSFVNDSELSAREILNSIKGNTLPCDLNPSEGVFNGL